MPIVSVVIPFFNRRKYLRKCIESILAQSLYDIELILVDDGSTDDSATIAAEYVDKDSRVRLIKQNNRGANRSRETGVKISKGEWIAFVDSDDTLPIDGLRYLSEYISDDYDIIMGSENNQCLLNEIIPLVEYRERCIKCSNGTIRVHGKLYRRNIFNHWVFNIPGEICIGEDLIMNMRLSFQTRKPVLSINRIVYNYSITDQSITARHNNTFDYICLLARQRRLSIPDKEFPKYSKTYFNKLSNLYIYEGYLKVRIRIPRDNTLRRELISMEEYKHANILRKLGIWLISPYSRTAYNYFLKLIHRFIRILKRMS